MTAQEALEAMILDGCDVTHESFPPTQFCRYRNGAVFFMQGDTALNRCSVVAPAALRTVLPDRDLQDGWFIHPAIVH